MATTCEDLQKDGENQLDELLQQFIWPKSAETKQRMKQQVVSQLHKA